jgi:hypothetical protein
MRRIARFAPLGALLVGPAAFAGVLAEDRADVLYHRYSGGGITIDGPSVLVRKKFGERFGASGNFYIDQVSSASVDVELTASPYEEEREQKSASFEYLRGKATYAAGVINSEESDYTADTTYFSLSQDMFGDLTTVSLSYKRGWDDVFRNFIGPDGIKAHDPNFNNGAGEDHAERRAYALGVSQILTRNMILGLNYEVQTDEGFLNNPYRQVRYVDVTPQGWSSEPEIYPRTRTSNAFSARVKYFLKYRAALEGFYRFYSDTWGIIAHTGEVGYTHPAWNKWVFDGKFRYYRQGAADFYRDLFPRQQFANFIARDKELATYQAFTAGVGAEYQFSIPRAPWIQRSTANIRLDHMIVNYDDFRDARVTKNAPGSVAAGAEPLYKLNATVFQVFVSIWF